MTTVTLDDALQARIQAVADPNEDIHAFIAAAARALIARRERQAAARIEAQAILNQPRHPFAESDADFRRRHNLPALAALTHEELSEQAEAVLAALPHATIAEAEQLGLL